MKQVVHYAPYFCEENIWHLCAADAVVDAGGAMIPTAQRHVIVIASLSDVCPTWQQRAAREDEPVLWDYHVVLSTTDSSGAQMIWDLDTRLPIPVSASTWLAESFPPRLVAQLPHEMQPHFRVICADEYRARFSSDRTHMLRDDGSALQPFPPWPPIVRGANNLGALRDMRSSVMGRVLSLVQLHASTTVR